MKKKRQRGKAYQADIGVFKNSGKEGSNIHFEVSWGSSASRSNEDAMEEKDKYNQK